jgi:putative ABC transport system permease protein
MIVSGVFRKSIKNSQLTFDMVRKGGEDNGIAFVRLSKNIEKIEFEKVLEKNKESIPIYHTDKPGAYSLVQLQDNYLGESSAAYIFSKRGRFDLWLAILISLFILVIALINYLGLVNNQLKSKVKEYAIRRINGSSKRFLVVGFMIENSILVGVAFVFSLFLAIWIAPFFNDLVNTNITPSFIFQFESMTILLGGLFIILFVTLIFVGFHIPFRASLSPLLFNKKARQFNLPLFSIIQLGISMVLIISSYVMLRQIQFIANKDIGIDETVVDIKLPAPYQSKTAIFKEELAKIPAIENVSVANGSPFSGRWIVPHVFDINGEKVEYSISIFSGDEHFVETLGIKLIAGSTFQGNHFNYKNKYLINQSFADLFPTQELIGEPIPGKANSLVIGIVEDFHYSNLKQVVTPAYIEYGNSGSHLLIKASENQMNLLLKEVAVVWEKLIPDFPLEATTIKQQFAFKHRENDNYVTIFSSCCLISIFLSMIGLFTISVQNSQNRTKEIGIRKVNGAKVFEIIQLLNKEFVIWIGVAFIIACPFAYYGMTKWLQNFAYKTTLEWWVFVLSGCIALGIALLTVSWQTFTAARRNPVEALHYE